MSLARGAEIKSRSLILGEIQERGEWNKYVLSLPRYDLRQGYEWGEVRSSQGWTPRRLAVFDNGACVAAVSILVRHIPILGRAVLYAPAGPLLSDVTDEGAWKKLLDGIRRVAAETKAIFLRADPKAPSEEERLRSALKSHGFLLLEEDWTAWNAPRISMTLSLSDAISELRHGIRKRFREYISSAPRRGLSVRPASSEADVRAFHRAMVGMGKTNGYPVRGILHFRALWENYIACGSGVLLLAEHRSGLAGGLLGAKFGRQAYMLYSTVDKSGDLGRLHQGPPLYWEFIRWAKEAGCESIHWGGSGTHFPPRRDDPGYGVYHFKLGFGSSLEYLLGYYDLIFRPQIYRALRLAERRLLPLAWNVRAKFNRPSHAPMSKDDCSIRNASYGDSGKAKV